MGGVWGLTCSLYPGGSQFLASQKWFFDEKFLRGRVSGQTFSPPLRETFGKSSESVFRWKKVVGFFVTQGGEGSEEVWQLSQKSFFLRLPFKEQFFYAILRYWYLALNLHSLTGRLAGVAVRAPIFPAHRPVVEWTNTTLARDDVKDIQGVPK